MLRHLPCRYRPVRQRGSLPASERDRREDHHGQQSAEGSGGPTSRNTARPATVPTGSLEGTLRTAAATLPVRARRTSGTPRSKRHAGMGLRPRPVVDKQVVTRPACGRVAPGPGRGDRWQLGLTTQPRIASLHLTRESRRIAPGRNPPPRPSQVLRSLGARTSCRGCESRG